MAAWPHRLHCPNCKKNVKPVGDETETRYGLCPKRGYSFDKSR